MSTLALKIVAICSMLLDHILKVLPVQNMLEVWWGVPMETSYWLLDIFEPLGRLAMPIFAFCVAEGCRHTHSPKRYLLRLGVFALVSEIPFRLAFTAPSREQDVYALHVFRFWPPRLTSVIATLFLGAVACLAYKKLTEKGHRLLGLLPLLPCLLLAEFMHADYGGWGVLLVFLPFALEKKKYSLPALGVALTLLYLVHAAWVGHGLAWMLPNYGHASYFANWLVALCALVLLGFYNGKRGGKGSPVEKWLFYVFYPGHLLALWGIAQVVNPLVLSWW